MKRYCTVLLLFFLFSCKTTEQDYSPDISRFSDSYIIMERMGCNGDCPEDIIKIFGTGKAEYIGKKNVEKEGKFIKDLSVKETDKIFNEYECIGFFDYRQEYLCGREGETILLTWKHRGWEKTITDCEAAPPELKKLQTLCEEVVNSKGWDAVN